jgi:ribosomal protein L11 methyltransferase
VTQWWDIYVQVPESMTDAISECLRSLGSAAVVIYDYAILAPQEATCIAEDPHAAGWTVLRGSLQTSNLLPSQFSRVQQCLVMWGQGRNPLPWKVYCRPLRDSGYLTQWQHFFQPLIIGEHLIVRPSWDTSPVPEGRPTLTLDPGLAFGTGTHPTTHMCLTLLTSYAPQYQGQALLDMGCGSGILSLAALKLGVRTAVGVDIDAQAVIVATHNAVLNTLQERAQFRQGSWEAGTGEYALITANIYLGPLIEMIHALARHLVPSGTLILSGIVEPQEAILISCLRAAGFTVRSRLVQEGWVALAVQRVERVHT